MQVFYRILSFKKSKEQHKRESVCSCFEAVTSSDFVIISYRCICFYAADDK
mgnify:CR=1 FL=1|jgi:hypothetical protein